MKTSPPDKRRNTVQSVVKALDLLDCFTAQDEFLSLDELHQRTKYPKSTLSNLLLTLEEMGYLRRGNLRGTYHLGHKGLEIAYRTLAGCGILSIASPVLEELMRETGQIVYLTTHVNGQILYLQCFYPGSRTISYSVTGKTNEMFCTGCGKAIMSQMTEGEVGQVLSLRPLIKRTPNTIDRIEDLKRHLELTRDRGYAIDNEEDCVGVKCVAMAINDDRSELTCGAISISGAPVTMTDEKMQDMIKILARSVQALKPYAHLFPYRYLEPRGLL